MGEKERTEEMRKGIEGGEENEGEERGKEKGGKEHLPRLRLSSGYAPVVDAYISIKMSSAGPLVRFKG